MALLQIKNLRKSFGDTEVLKGIDVEFEKGQVVSILGSSGSGKTTLLRCINFLENADSGVMILDDEILFDAQKNQKISERELRKKRLNFGLVFQSFNLFPQYNVKKNVSLAPTLLLKEKIKEYKNKLKTKNLSKKEFKLCLNEFISKNKEDIENQTLLLLSKVGLKEKANSYPCELSGGQCQRVAIARALSLKPKILCFDEPTSSLDPELTGEVLNVIKALKDDEKTMIIVTHEMGFAKNVSDKIVFMADGVIEEEGNAKEIFENPKSQKLISFLANSKKEGEI